MCKNVQQALSITGRLNFEPVYFALQENNRNNRSTTNKMKKTIMQIITLGCSSPNEAKLIPMILPGTRPRLTKYQ
ncbi:MAG: hypothetical protein LBT50_00200 [Prevotellaceae bacterium]|nr:hypothetical protein [Prevotellaceae bacterium]